MTLSSKILEHFPVACIYQNEKGRIDYVNLQAELLFGKLKTEILGLSFQEVFPESKTGPMSKLLTSISDGQAPLSYDFFWELSLSWVRLTAVPFENGLILSFQASYNEQGEPKQFSLTKLQNILNSTGDSFQLYQARYHQLTAEKINLKNLQLKQSEERLRLFVIASSDMVYRMNADWSTMYLLEGKEFLTDTHAPSTDWLERYIPKKEHPKVKNAIKAAIENKSIFELEHQVFLSDGGTGWTCSRAIPVLNEEGQIIEWFGTAKDMSLVKQAEQRLRHMEIQQQQEILRVTLNIQEEERLRISESLHNGLGQLLYATKLSVDYLSLALAIDTPEKFHTAKLYTNELLNNSINDCRNISRELTPIILAEFGLKAAINDICRQMNISLTVHCCVELQNVQLDKFIEIAIFRTVQELVLNVVKHAMAQKINIEVVIEDNTVVIRVEDDGKGFIVHNTVPCGIGLPSIQAKAALLKGNIHISSSADKGTCVEVRLPLCLINDQQKASVD